MGGYSVSLLLGQFSVVPRPGAAHALLADTPQSGWWTRSIVVKAVLRLPKRGGMVDNNDT